MELARELPIARPDAERRETMRAGLLAQAELAAPRRSARGRWIAIGGVALAAAAAVAFFASRGSSPVSPAAIDAPAPRAEVIAIGASDYDHVAETSAAGTSDVVRLRDGRLRVNAPLPLRVDIGDAEVDGERGGAYEIAVEHGAIREVAVERGHAQIKVKGAKTIFLSSGETWKPTIQTATFDPPARPPVIAPPPAPIAPRTPAHHSISISHEAVPDPDLAEARSPKPEAPAAAKPLSESEQSFTTGWALLRAGHFADAAQHFGAAVDSDPNSPLADDARYFQAVALARAGRTGDAEHVLTTFLDHAPRSLRRGRASLMLGWLLAARGERDAARARFDDAARDPDDSIAAGARAGLAALDQR
ncbi:MAG TPA: tetratricopeptide repeat protein [Kofleriaceae bacterium]|nr:tetratricopeptide repeat protein [Kofleriaceae bacterium]